MTQVLGACSGLLRFAKPLPWQSRQFSMPGINESWDNSEAAAS